MSCLHTCFSRRMATLPVVVTFWGISLFVGFAAIWTHASTPGDVGIAAEKWPPNTRLRLSEALPTLVVFVHPECPCSRATLSHVASIVDQAKTAVTIVAMTPPLDRPITGTSGGCRDRLETLAKNPSVTSLDDVQNEAASRFGASTSGDCFLYSTDGDLLFRGGVTSSRGHVGNNAGLHLVLQRINDHSQPVESYPVFGCSLIDSR